MSRMRRKSPALQTRLRRIEFCIISAQGLKNVRKFGGKMHAYAVAYVSSPDGGGGGGGMAATRVDVDGGANPTWDEKLSLDVAEATLEDGRAQLSIEIWSRRPRRLSLSSRDKLVGSVRLLLGDAVGSGGGGGDEERRRRGLNRFPVASYLVFRPSGEPQGILNVCIPPGGIFPDRLDSISFKDDRRQHSGAAAVATEYTDFEELLDGEETTSTTEGSFGLVHSVRSSE